MLWRLSSKAPEISQWISVHWVVSYSDGLIHRGLVGTLVNLFINNLNFQHITLIFSIFYVFLIFFFCSAAIYFHSKFNTSGMILLLALIISHPLTLFYFTTISNFGRFDMFLLILFIVSVFLIHKHSNSIRFFAVPVLGALGVLTHQNYLLFFAPFLFFYYLLISKEKNHFSRIKQFLLLAPIAAFTAVSFFGYINYETPEEMTASLASGHSLNIMEGPVKMEYFTPLSEHFRLNLSHIQNPVIFLHLLSGIILLMPTFYIFYVFWRNYTRVREKETAGQGKKLKVPAGCAPGIMFFISTFSPLTLFFIGIDYFRWLSAFTICNFTAILLILDRPEKTSDFF